MVLNLKQSLLQVAFPSAPSALGPLIIVTYTNDLPCNVKSNVHLFADDIIHIKVLTH